MWGGYLKCVCALVYLGDESSELQSRPRFYSNSFRARLHVGRSQYMRTGVPSFAFWVSPGLN